MIRALVGDLFASDAQTLVNTVNCVGVMGKGIALGFKKRFPEMYQDYVERCDAHQVHLGEPYLFRSLFPPYIVNFPTKDHWRSVSNLEDIVSGLEFLERHYRDWSITSLAVPPLGCGQGQLEWRVVGPTLYRYFSRFEIPIEMYAPVGTPLDELEASFLGQHVEIRSPVPVHSLNGESEPLHINPSWVALAEVVARIGREYYHWPVGRVRFQKIAYFATALGLPTGFHFERGSYGPFSPEVKTVLTKLVNNGILREDATDHMLLLTTGTTYSDAVQAPLFQLALRNWGDDIDRIADLLLRVPTSDTELAATVHYAWAELSKDLQGQVTKTRLMDEVRHWKERRKPPLSDETILRTMRNLDLLKWIAIEPDDATIAEQEELLLGV